MGEQTTIWRESGSFGLWLRTGRRVPAQLTDPALEVKFNPYHDPRNGQFTFGPESGGSDSADMARRPKRVRRGGTRGSGTFTGGGGGSFGGGGASGSGYWMNPAEIGVFRKRYPNREPHMVGPGETLDQIAAAHHLTALKLRRLNGLSPNARVQPGQISAGTDNCVAKSPGGWSNTQSFTNPKERLFLSPRPYREDN